MFYLMPVQVSVSQLFNPLFLLFYVCLSVHLFFSHSFIYHLFESVTIV